jgi:hypothetical protein
MMGEGVGSLRFFEIVDFEDYAFYEDGYVRNQSDG